MTNIEQKLGFDRIRQMVADQCSNALAVRMADDMSFSTDYDHLRHDLHKPYYVAMVAAMHKLFLHMNSVAARVRKEAASG